MMQLIAGLGAVYVLSYVCSTPESRAAAVEPVNRFGKRLFALTMGFFAVLFLLTWPVY